MSSWMSELVPYVVCLVVCVLTLLVAGFAYKTCQNADERTAVRDASVRWTGWAITLFLFWAVVWHFAGPIGGWSLLLLYAFGLYSFWSSCNIFYHRAHSRAAAVFND